MEFILESFLKKYKYSIKPHRLVSRRPAALPAQVQPLPDWTLLVRLCIHRSPTYLQGPGRRQRRQTVKVEGQGFLTCSRDGWFQFRRECCAAAEATL